MYTFFHYGVLKFKPGLALRGLLCGMIVRARDNARSGLDECPTQCQLSKINFENLKCTKESIYF